jgi:hypothetical protein
MLKGRRRLEKRRRRPKRMRMRRPGGRRPSRTWWSPDDLMRAKTLRIFGLRGSSPPRVVQCLSILLLVFIYLLLNDFYYKYILNLYM